MNERRPRVVLFDFDGVLVDSNPVWWDAIERILKERQIVSSTNAVDRVNGYPLSQAIRTVAPIGDEEIAEIEEAVYRATEPALLRQSLMEGAANVIDRLVLHRFTLGVVSSSRQALVARVLENNGVLRRFSVTVSGDDVGRAKPYPDPYLLAVAQLRTEAMQCWAIEDSVSGLRSAAEAGLATIYFCPGTSEKSAVGIATFVAHTFDDVLDHLLAP